MFIDSDDWGLYLTVCCKLQQIKMFHDCSTTEAVKLLISDRRSHSKSGCLIRLITAFNSLYAEYSKVYDLNKSLRRTDLAGSENKESASTSSSSTYLINNFSESLTDRNTNNNLIIPKGTKDFWSSFLGSNLDPSGDFQLSDRFSREATENKRLTSCDNVKNNEWKCNLSNYCEIDPNNGDANVNVHRKSNKIEFASPPPSPKTPPLHSSFTYDVTETKGNSKNSSNAHAKSRCFIWRRKISTERSCSESRTTERDTICQHNDFFVDSQLTPRKIVNAYYDKIYRKHTENAITVFQLSIHRRTVEHCIQLANRKLFSKMKHNNSNSESILSNTVRLPIVLELAMPKMQRQIEQITKYCPYLDNPLEIIAELRYVNYDTDECIAYFKKVRKLRDIGQEMVVNTYSLNREINQRREHCRPTEDRLLNSCNLKESGKLRINMNKDILSLLVELKSFLIQLKEDKNSTLRKLARLKSFTLNMTNEFMDSVEKKLAPTPIV
uniref:Uncharacterized protein n=1 Tax=Trichobilharzia regenti TaxID=157069 RepID=A0AA85JFZ2_TRIRE|nr:unnamed protein product [Trichobilharzia regenti]